MIGAQSFTKCIYCFPIVSTWSYSSLSLLSSRSCSLSSRFLTRCGRLFLPRLPSFRLYSLRRLSSKEGVGDLLDAWNWLSSCDKLYNVREGCGVWRWGLTRSRRSSRKNPAYILSTGRRRRSLYPVGYEGGAASRRAVCFVCVEVDVQVVFPKKSIQARAFCSWDTYLA